MVPAHPERRLQLGILGVPESRTLAEAHPIRSQKPAPTAESLQQFARQIDRRAPGAAGTQEDREKLGIKERAGSAGPSVIAMVTSCRC